MTLKIDKTKSEFVEGMVEDLPGTWSRGERRVMAAAMVSALDLEFQGPEGRKITNLDLELPGKDELRQEAARRHNAFPDLLALSRELEEEVAWWQKRWGLETPRNHRAVSLLARARDLLDRLEGGRE